MTLIRLVAAILYPPIGDGDVAGDVACDVARDDACISSICFSRRIKRISRA